jgi:hypothetical protein
MHLSGLNRSGWARLAVTTAASLLAAAAWAQSQPKFPTPLPVPKAPEASVTPAPAPPPATPSAAAPATGGPRDPFEPLVRKAEPGEEKRIAEVTNLKLVGVLWDVKDPEAIRALVETPDGLGYYLRLNEERFGAKVVAVERDRVRFVVREDSPGAGVRERTVELRLPRPDGP